MMHTLIQANILYYCLDLEFLPSSAPLPSLLYTPLLSLPPPPPPPPSTPPLRSATAVKKPMYQPSPIMSLNARSTSICVVTVLIEVPVLSISAARGDQGAK